MRLFKQKKYEVMVLMSREEHVNKKLKGLQDNGWEISGDILVKNKSGWCNDNYMHIPLKRKI